MMRNFGVVYMNSYKYAYFLLPEHTKKGSVGDRTQNRQSNIVTNRLNGPGQFREK